MKLKVKHLLMYVCLIMLSATILLAQDNRTEDHEEEGDNPQARLDFEFLKTKDPKTGKVPENIRMLELAYMREQSRNRFTSFAEGDISSPWINRGPFNVGGRTRALAVDIRNENVILAGGVSGGMWRSVDQGATWQKTTGSNELQSVTCIAQDPTAPDTWYYGSGEFSGNSASGSGAFFLGDGIYKSVDNGTTWEVLPSTSTDVPESFDQAFDLNMEIIVDPTNGDVYAATLGTLFRSTDGGVSFEPVLSDNGSQWVDVTVSSEGVLYAALDAEGIFTSENGVDWTDITPPSGFQLVRGERKELALAPSNEDILYLIGEDASRNGGEDVPGHSFWRFDAGTTTWVDRSASIPRIGGTNGNFTSQGGYDLLIKVKPDDENFVIIGGTVLWRSTNGFANTSTNVWIGGYTPANTSFALYPDHHPDQHSFVYLSGDRAISGNDGGIQITNDITSFFGVGEPVDWIPLNNGYVTTQVYALSNGPGDQIMAGFQDNSVWLTTSPETDAIWTDQFGGDGAYNAFNSDGSVRYMSSQNANIFRVNYNGGADDITADNFTDFAPTGHQAPLFITPFYLDPINDDLFYLAGVNALFVNTQASTGSANAGWRSIFLTGSVSEIGVSPSDVVYAGTTTGQVYRINNPATSNTANNITGDNMPQGFVSAIAVDPTDPNTVLVTFSNYSIPSVFFTDDGGETWRDVSGNLEENIDGTGSGPSVRSATIVGRGDRYFVGTSTGLYSTTSLSGDVVWTQENPAGIGEVVVEHLVSRSSDGLVLAGTHGNGIYSANYEVTPPSDNDLAIVTITSPDAEIRTSSASETVVSAIVRNPGANSQSSFEASYTVNDEVVSTETFNIELAPGVEQEFSFDATFDFSTPGNYELLVSVNLDGDEDEGNDVASLDILAVEPIETFPYIETFDDSDELPAQWFVENSTFAWLINGFTTPSNGTGPVGDNTSGQGNYAYAEATGATFENEAFLATPWLSITGMERPALQFSYHMFGSEMGDLEVLVFDEDEELTPVFLLEGQQQESSADSFIEEIVSLEDFVNQDIRIVFRAVAGTSFRSDMAIDDVKVFNIPNNDLAIEAIISPEENVSGTEPVIVEIRNRGIDPQSGFEVSYFVNDVEVVTETVNGTLAVGSSLEYAFVQQFDFSERRQYNIRATVNLTGDEDATNDEQTATVSNLAFTGFYLMEQAAVTETGPSNQFGNGNLFDLTGLSRVFITATSDTERVFNIRYFNYQNFNNEAIPINFNLDPSGETLLTREIFTGLNCAQNGGVILGPADSNGAYDESDDSTFSLVIKEDIFEGCQVGSSDVTFNLIKAPRVNEADSLALLALYNSTDGDNWNESWDLEESAFLWEGVTISRVGRVEVIDLGQNNLIGTLPAEIGDLTALVGLDLADNRIEGILPVGVGNLTALQVLNLAGNSLRGSLPAEIGNLTLLEEIILLNNEFSGEIPTEIGALTNLTRLTLSFNNFSGNIPAVIGNMTNLNRLNLGGNNLEGTVPEELSGLTDLLEISLSDNNLEGAIPAGFINLSRLTTLTFSGNRFTELPDLSMLTLQTFFADFNNLDFGDIIPNVPFLSSFIPQADIGDPLTLSGTAGEDLDLITDTPDDGNNQYQWFKDDVVIEGATDATFVLAYTGSTDEGLYRCDVTNTGAPGLTLSRFITVIDETVTERPGYAVLEAFYNATGGPNWIDNTNWLTSANFNDWTGVLTDFEGNVTSISLGENNLIGNLIPEISNLSELRSLQLFINDLSGEIPMEIWSIADLIDLNLAENNLSGSIPPEVAGMTSLVVLGLSDNDFSGTLPSELGTLASLESLSLSNNSFEGEIIADLGDLGNLRSLHLSRNNFEGAIPDELSNLSNLRSLRLSGNNLTGTIPSDLGQLSNLEFLILGNNNLEGSLPETLGDLTSLAFLNASSNNLTGEIPASLSNLTMIQQIGLWDNNLTGALPDLSGLTTLTLIDVFDNNLDQLPAITNLPNLTSFRVEDNALDFSDIVPNISLLTEFTPQANLDDEIEETVNQGTEFSMEVSDDTDGNEYQWFLNEQAIEAATTRTYSIASFQVVDQGVYICEVTNPAAPGLTLFRNPVTLDINFSPGGITLEPSAIAEDEEVGTLVGEFMVTDFDEGDVYTWVISGPDAASFTVDGNRLLSAEVFDFETKNSFEITGTVKDRGNLEAQVDFTISITNVNEVPVLEMPIGNQVTDEDAAFTLMLPEEMFSDGDGDDLTIEVTGLPTGLSYDAATRNISGTPLQEGVGANTVTVTATDPAETSATDSFVITVNNVNDAPTIETAQADQEINEDEAYTYTIPESTFSDEDGDELTITVTGLPANLTFDQATSTISGTPLQTDVGVHTVNVTATEPSGAEVTDSFELTIVNVNDAPVVVTEQADQAINEDAAYEYMVPASTFDDEDNDALTLSVTGLPTSLAFDPVSGRITGTPLVEDTGSYNIEVTATDPGMLAVTDVFELVVNAVNDNPVVVNEIPDMQTDRDAPFELTIDPANATDEEGDPITVSVVGLPASLTLDNNTISGTPGPGENGAFTVTVIYSDDNGGSVNDAFILTVNLVTGLEEEKEYGVISVQPNPFTNEIKLIVEKGLFGKTSFSLQPIGGESVWNSIRSLSGETELTLQINKPIAQGIYLLIVNPDGKTPIVRKVIKKQ